VLKPVLKLKLILALKLETHYRWQLRVDLMATVKLPVRRPACSRLIFGNYFLALARSSMCANNGSRLDILMDISCVEQIVKNAAVGVSKSRSGTSRITTPLGQEPFDGRIVCVVVCGRSEIINRVRLDNSQLVHMKSSMK